MPHLRQHILETRSGSATTFATRELLPEADHGVAKLDPPQVLLRYQAWLRTQLDAHP